jgi:hypothetical protein
MWTNYSRSECDLVCITSLITYNELWVGKSKIRIFFFQVKTSPTNLFNYVGAQGGSKMTSVDDTHLRTLMSLQKPNRVWQV